MKKLATFGLVVVALSAAAVVYAAKPSPGFPNADLVFGGGHAVILGSGRTFSLSATRSGGTVMRDGGVVRITCETIEGNAAVLGGGPLAANGQFFEMEVVDNGLPVDGNTAGDQISPFILLSGATSAPTTCPAPSQFNPGELDTVDAGDIIVHAKGT